MSLHGIVKKVGILLLVALAYQASLVIGDNAIKRAVVYAFVLSEGWSVLENAAALDIFIPETLKAIFEKTNRKKFE